MFGVVLKAASDREKKIAPFWQLWPWSVCSIKISSTLERLKRKALCGGVGSMPRWCWWSWEEKKRWAAKKTKTVTKCQGECFWSVRFWVNEQVVTLWATEQSQTLTRSDTHMSRYTQAISFSKVLCQSSCSFLLLPSYLFHSESHVNSDSTILLKVSLFLHLLMKGGDRSETTSNDVYPGQVIQTQVKSMIYVFIHKCKNDADIY